MLGIAKMATGISLHKYQVHIRGNQTKALLDSDQESDKDNEIDLDTIDKDI